MKANACRFGRLGREPQRVRADRRSEDEAVEVGRLHRGRTVLPSASTIVCDVRYAGGSGLPSSSTRRSIGPLSGAALAITRFTSRAWYSMTIAAPGSALRDVLGVAEPAPDEARACRASATRRRGIAFTPGSAPAMPRSSPRYVSGVTSSLAVGGVPTLPSSRQASPEARSRRRRAACASRPRSACSCLHRSSCRAGVLDGRRRSRPASTLFENSFQIAMSSSSATG